MFYEEKIINGVLHYRITPDSLFKPFTAEQMTTKWLEVKQYLEDLARCVAS
jgi:hypothetical protein